MSYRELEEAGIRILRADSRSEQALSNMRSALHTWMRTLGALPDATVGDEFAGAFDLHFLRFQDLQAERLAMRTQKDRAEQVLTWRRLYEAARIVDTLPESFTEALRSMFNRSGITKAALARWAGIQAPMLTGWIVDGRLPGRSSYDAVLSLERALGLPAETLLRRLPPRRLCRYARESRSSEPNQYGMRMARNARATGTYALKPTERIRAQWSSLMTYKTGGAFPGATVRNTWRVKPVSRTGQTVRWSMVSDVGICMTGGVEWNFIRSYLGYLALAVPKGMGVPLNHADTLAWLAYIPYVDRYLKWQKARSDGIAHNGPITFLSKVLCHLRPGTGFLWANPSIARTLPAAILKECSIDADASAEELAGTWRSHCEAARSAAAEILLRVESSSSKKMQRSRDPRQRIARLLSDRFPLKRLESLVQELERDAPPTTHLRDYAAWIRDVLLLRMALSNPLRTGQFSVMTYFSNQSGNLYRADSGEWRMRFLAADFKNEKGAACEDYDVGIDESVWPWIQRYLAESRPNLIGADSVAYVFLPSVNGPRRGNADVQALGIEPTGMWSSEGIGARVKAVTARLLPETGGFGLQAWRHIIATDHLKRHPKDYMNVATLLHDTMKTVFENYKHLEVDVGLKVLHDGVRLARAELAAERNGAGLRAVIQTPG